MVERGWRGVFETAAAAAAGSIKMHNHEYICASRAAPPSDMWASGIGGLRNYQG